MVSSSEKLEWKKSNPEIDLKTFSKHFKELSANFNESITIPDNSLQETSVQQLDNEISVSEIEQAIKCVKLGKAPGLDTLPSELFIDSTEILTPHLAVIFNHIFQSHGQQGL